MKKNPPIAGIAGWTAAAIFLGAFLLFQIQPIISKTILSWFGGSPAVWTTSLLFFQVVLLAGYAFADRLVRWPQPRQQALIHLGLVLLACLTLPITPSGWWRPPDSTSPTWRILVLLSATVGLPYFLLAAISPALQFWFARVYPNRSPYRLYALSNIGSLGALLSYPFLVEPVLTTRTQGMLWSFLFVLFALCCGQLTYRLWKLGPLPELPEVEDPVGVASRRRRTAQKSAGGNGTLSWRLRGTWFAWPALACILLMAVTNHLCQDLAVVPFLWVAPLSLYLLTFIICFDRAVWYHRRGFAWAAALAVLAVSYLPMATDLERFYRELGLPFRWAHYTRHIAVETGVYLASLFLICMVCHGELVRRKPPARHLTAFYLSVAAGGALGGVLVALLCPLFFSSYVELNLAMVLSFFLAVAILLDEVGWQWFARTTRLLRSSALLTGLLATMIVLLGQFDRWDRERGIERARNFYGVVSIRERFAGPDDDPEHHGLAMFHGNTVHGYQLLREDLKHTPTTYYGETSGVGLTLLHLRPDTPLRVGGVGLGVGTVAAYGRPGDTYRFYEINPLVIDLCERHFTFLQDSEATIEPIVLGDARLSLEIETPQEFDVLVLDAFSGDTIPVHLLTREALQTYLQHMVPDGVLAFHVSNRYVNLIPVALELAHDAGLQSVLIRQAESEGLRKTPSDWVLMTRNSRFLDQRAIREAARYVNRWPDFPVWTDQYNNLLWILHPPVIRE